MAMLQERDDQEGAGPSAPARRWTKRHYQAVIQAEIRRLAGMLDTGQVAGHDAADASVMDRPPAFGELR